MERSLHSYPGRRGSGSSGWEHPQEPGGWHGPDAPTSGPAPRTDPAPRCSRQGLGSKAPARALSRSSKHQAQEGLWGLGPTVRPGGRQGLPGTTRRSLAGFWASGRHWPPAYSLPAQQMVDFVLSPSFPALAARPFWTKPLPTEKSDGSGRESPSWPMTGWPHLPRVTCPEQVLRTVSDLRI